MLALALTASAVHDANASVEKQNIVQLIANSQSIVAGTVNKVTDGIDANGLPYTEITIQVGISPKGGIGQGAYTFRQFGLIKPRILPNGQRMLMVTRRSSRNGTKTSTCWPSSTTRQRKPDCRRRRVSRRASW
jgi:hypothetical protein